MMGHSPSEAAKLTGLHRNTILNKIMSGEIEARKLPNGYWDIELSSVLKFMQQWGEESEKAEERLIGKQYIIEQLNEKINNIVVAMKTIKPNDEQFRDMAAAYVRLVDAKTEVESIQIPSTAIQ